MLTERRNGHAKLLLCAKNIPDRRGCCNKNLLRTDQLLCRNAFDRTTAQRLRDHIIATNPLTERKWFLAQL